MLNKTKLAILIATIPFIILGVAVYYAFQYPVSRSVVSLGAPSANLTRDIAPIFNSTSTDSAYGNFSVGSSTANYYGLFARYASTTAISVSTGTATTTIAGGLATSTFAGGIQFTGVANICLTSGTCLGGAGASGITSLNGLTGATQTFTHPDGQNTSLTITSAGTDHEFKLIDSMSPVWENFMATSTTASSTVVNRFNVSGVLNASSTLLVGTGLTVYTGAVDFPNGSIANADLANSTISGVALGASLGALTATNATLTFSASYDGSVARTVGLNLANENIWTASTTFPILNVGQTLHLENINASSTATSTFAGGINVASIGGLSSASGLTITGGNINFASGSFSALDGGGLTTTSGALAVGAGTCITANANDVAVTTNCTDATTLDSINGASLLRSDASDSYTSGTLTFDASTILDLTAASARIPNAANPTVTTLGYMALDTTNNELLMATSTTGGAVVYAKEIKQLYSFVLASTSPAFKSGETLPLPSKEMGFTAYYIQCNVWGGTSIVANLTDSTGNDTGTVTCDTTTSTQRTLVTNNVWTAAEGAAVEVGTITGTPNYLLMSIWGIWSRR